MSIVVEKLCKQYGTQKAVNELSFEVKTGEILGFLGPNGAGKTTTMKMLTCFMAPTSGTALVSGVSISDQPDLVKRKIGYLPEHNPLYLDMPIIDYLSFSAAIQGVAKSDIQKSVHKMIATCGLNKEKHKNIGELSKGYRQRVGLAQALIHDPEILILDEPTTGLDPNQRVEIRNLIKSIGQEKTVIFSTHILPEVEATCDRVMIIDGGEIKEEGTTEEIKKKAKGQEIINVTIEEAGDYNQLFKQLQSLNSVQMVDALDKSINRFQIQSRADQSSKKALFQFCVQKGYVLSELTPVETSLEDVFRELTLS